MSSDEKDLALHGDDLFARVAAILEAARGNVVRAVNSNMVLAYFLIGREIVEVVQEGEETAEYGKGVLRRLSEQLTARFGTGYSERNLRHFRQFYQTFEGRIEIRNPSGSISLLQPSVENRNPSGSTFIAREESPTPLNSSFAPELTWSHYRALSRVSDPKARDFYESEAIECGWSKAQLERQIQSSLYQRILANRGEEGLVSKERERLAGEAFSPRDILRSPLVLEFLELPDSPSLHESKLEQAIIENLQSFMLELGKGFAFVARQKHIRFEDDDFYIDLVFYNYLLKCFLLVDLKIGKVSHPATTPPLVSLSVPIQAKRWPSTRCSVKASRSSLQNTFSFYPLSRNSSSKSKESAVSSKPESWTTMLEQRDHAEAARGAFMSGPVHKPGTFLTWVPPSLGTETSAHFVQTKAKTKSEASTLGSSCRVHAPTRRVHSFWGLVWRAPNTAKARGAGGAQWGSNRVRGEGPGCLSSESACRPLLGVRGCEPIERAVSASGSSFRRAALGYSTVKGAGLDVLSGGRVSIIWGVKL